MPNLLIFSTNVNTVKKANNSHSFILKRILVCNLPPPPVWSMETLGSAALTLKTCSRNPKHKGERDQNTDFSVVFSVDTEKVWPFQSTLLGGGDMTQSLRLTDVAQASQQLTVILLTRLLSAWIIGVWMSFGGSGRTGLCMSYASGMWLYYLCGPQHVLENTPERLTKDT